MTSKLARRLNTELATLLVAGELTTPGKIRRATDEEVTTSVGSENLAAVRAVFPEKE